MKRLIAFVVCFLAALALAQGIPPAGPSDPATFYSVNVTNGPILTPSAEVCPSALGCASARFLMDGTYWYLIGGSGVQLSSPIFKIGSGTSQVTTAGTLGVTPVVATGNLSAQTAAVASLATFTTPNDGNKHALMVNGFIKITTFSSGSITLAVAFTDETGAAQTGNVQLNVVGTSGFTNVAGAANLFQGAPLYLEVNPNTSVTMKTTGTFTSLTYDVGASVVMVN